MFTIQRRRNGVRGSHGRAIGGLTAGGFTLVELAAAITIAGGVSALVFISYAGLMKSFRRFEFNNRRVNEMLLIKSAMDGLLSKAGTADCGDGRELRFGCEGSDTVHVLRRAGDELWCDDRKIAGGLAGLVFSMERRPGDGRCALFWEAECGAGGWIGGAIFPVAEVKQPAAERHGSE